MKFYANVRACMCLFCLFVCGHDAYDWRNNAELMMIGNNDDDDDDDVCTPNTMFRMRSHKTRHRQS